MLELIDAGYRYPLTDAVALEGVSLSIAAGERVLLCGPSGSGKSTLLRLASGLLASHGRGRVTGSVRIDGRNPAGLSPRARSARLGFVGQEPGDQLVAGSVADEVGFGPESQALPRTELDQRVRSALQSVGLDVGQNRDPRELSGGQQQRVAVAAALAGGGRLLLLDEPLARLDPPGASALLDVLHQLSLEGVAVLLAEHRLARCLPWANRVVALRSGALCYDGDPANYPVPEPLSRANLAQPGAVVLDLPALSVHYGSRLALHGVSIQLKRGERVALTGPNGAGKSTLLGAISGRLAPREPGPRVIEVPQDPDLALFNDTVRDELAYGPREAGLSEQEVAARVAQVAGPLGLESLMERPPQALSGGERLRLAVGAALTCRPDVILLDEPTAGQDTDAIRGLLRALTLAAPDAAVVIATHDLALADAETHRILALRGGRIGELGPAPESAPEVEVPTSAWSLDPRARLGLLGAVGALAVILDRPLSLALLAAVSGSVLFALPIGWAWRKRALGIALALAWTTAFSQGLFYGEVPRVALVHLGPLTLWREGLLHGLAQSLRLLAAAFAGVALAVSTPTDRLVAALGAFRLPWSVGLLAAVALRSAPSVAQEWALVRQARAARGRPVLARSPWAWLLLETRMLRPVAARSLRRARALALSLDARGFDPEAPRTLRRPLQMGWRDLALLVPAWTLVFSAATLELLYRAYLAEALYLPALRPVYGWVRVWL